jgi:hypothetical protein
MELSIGILIIGSLYWDDEGRENWRQWRLKDDRKWLVSVPIRYGRISSKRDCTYTMIFSRLAPENFGRAIVIECQRPVKSVDDLMDEARWLWSAERGDVPKNQSVPLPSATSADWGRVALLARPSGCIAPNSSRAPESDRRVVSEYWTKHAGSGDVELLVTDEGCLDLDWPEHADGSGPVTLDLLLATTNRPNDRDPTAKTIADAWNQRGHRNYFDENRTAGIGTFQDPEILRYLK